MTKIEDLQGARILPYAPLFIKDPCHFLIHSKHSNRCQGFKMARLKEEIPIHCECLGFPDAESYCSRCQEATLVFVLSIGIEGGLTPSVSTGRFQILVLFGPIIWDLICSYKKIIKYSTVDT
jgi:hypothetical protein